MIALVCVAFLAVASAAPAPQRLISSSQVPVTYQTVQSPIQTVQTLRQSPYVQTLQQPYQTVQTLQAPYQTVQTIQGLQSLDGLEGQTLRLQGLEGQTLRSNLVQPQLVQYQTVPYNTVSGLNLQPAQVRVSQIRPTQLRTQTIVQQPIVQTVQSNIAPLTIKQVAPAARVQVVPQVQTIQTVAPQVQTVVPQVQRINTLQATYGQRANLYSNKYASNQYAYNQAYQGVAPTAPEGVNILRQVQEVQADGTYAYAFETENGIKAQEEGRTLNQGTNQESSVVQGSYSYTAPDGTPITVNYVADENGFRAEGEHIPKPSEEIARAVEYLRSLPPRPEDQEGKYTPDSNGY